jgi:hypothetical protein
MKTMGEWRLTWALYGGDWTVSRPGRFTPGVGHTGNPWKGDGWTPGPVGTRRIEVRKILATCAPLQLEATMSMQRFLGELGRAAN